MNALSATAAQSDTDFLAENFSQLDISTGKFSSKLPDIKNAKVVLIGEVHFSTLLQKIHAQFLQRFVTDSSCLLIEGAPPGVQLDQSQVTHYRMYPQSLKIFGSDIRSLKESTEESAVFINRMFELSQGVEDFIEQIQAVIRCVNELFENGDLQLFNDGLLAKVNHVLKIRELLIESYKHLNNTRDEFLNVCSGGGQMDLIRSNAALMTQIKHKSTQFEKIFAIWGAGHFKLDREFHHALAQFGSPVVVLLPSQANVQKSEIHGKCAMDKYKSLFLHMYTSNDDKRTYRFPFALAPLFLPKIQQILPMKSKLITFTADELLSYLSDKDNILHIDSGTKLQLRGIDLASFESLSVEKENEQRQKIISRMLNNWLTFSKARFAGVDGAISKYKLSHEEYDLCITFSFNEPAKLTIDTRTVCVDLSHLFNEMCYRNISSYSLSANQALVLDTQDPQTAKDIESNPQQLAALFKSHLPPHIHGMQLTGLLHVLAFTAANETHRIILTGYPELIFVLKNQDSSLTV